MRDYHGDAIEPFESVTLDGLPAIRLASGRVMILPSGGDGSTEPTPTEPTPPAPDGGDPPAEEPPAPSAEVEPIPDVPETLAPLDEDALRDLHAALDASYTARRQSARTTAELDELRGIREHQNGIASELTRRAEEQAAVIEQLAQLDSELAPSLPEAVPAMANVTAAQVASLRGTQPAVAQSPPPAAPARPRVAMMAAASTEIVGAGLPMDWSQLGQAVDRAKRGRAGSAILASLPAYEEMADFDRASILSGDHGAGVNDRMMDEAREAWKARRVAARSGEPPVRTAAICGPLDIIRDIPSAFNTAEPVRGIFPSRPAGRLGYQFTPSLDLADVLTGVTLWDETDQANVDDADSATWKPCVEVTCPDTVPVRAEAVPACLTFDITTEMSNPERIANATSALMALKARTKEGRILQLIDSLSSHFTFEGAYGALPAVVEALNTMIAQAVYANRQDDPDYTLILPPGVAQILAIDRANRAYGVEAEVSDVLAYLRANLEGVGEIVMSLDASLGGEPGLPFAALPAVGVDNQVALPAISCEDYRLRLVDPAAALYSETGEVNVGVGRDTNLQRRNKAQFFTEDFFMLAKPGPQSWLAVDITLNANGARAGLIEPTDCAS